GAPFLPLAGGKMNGMLTLDAPPSAALDAATKQYVDSQVSSVSGIVEAPQDGLVYGRSNAHWTAVVANNNIGRNLLHNPLFNVAQRGVGPFAGSFQYTLDRWCMANVLDTWNVTQAPITDGARGSIGDEAAAVALQVFFVGSTDPTAFCQLQQRIESVRRLAGKTVTVSFWAACAAGTLKLGLNLVQTFGVGGSPSAQVLALSAGASVTLSTTYTRYSVTVSMPSVAGKTFGTTPGTDFTLLQFGLSAGANGSPSLGNIGVQTGTINLWGVQLEIGSVATPLEKPDPRYDLANCQRFYCTCQYSWFGYGALGYNTSMYTLPMTMRGTPTITNNVTSSAGANSPTIDPSSPSVVRLNIQCPVVGPFNYLGSFTASADL